MSWQVEILILANLSTKICVFVILACVLSKNWVFLSDFVAELLNPFFFVNLRKLLM